MKKSVCSVNSAPASTPFEANGEHLAALAAAETNLRPIPYGLNKRDVECPFGVDRSGQDRWEGDPASD
jgi:hypothetical protein